MLKWVHDKGCAFEPNVMIFVVNKNSRCDYLIFAYETINRKKLWTYHII